MASTLLGTMEKIPGRKTNRRTSNYVIRNQMKKIFFIVLFFVACASKNDSNVQSAAGDKTKAIKDTLTYAYKALYSSDITVPSHPEYAQKVLTVWKMFESSQIQAMRPYWADTVTYHDAGGLNFHGSANAL